MAVLARPKAAVRARTLLNEIEELRNGDLPERALHRSIESIAAPWAEILVLRESANGFICVDSTRNTLVFDLANPEVTEALKIWPLAHSKCPAGVRRTEVNLAASSPLGNFRPDECYALLDKYLRANGPERRLSRKVPPVANSAAVRSDAEAPAGSVTGLTRLTPRAGFVYVKVSGSCGVGQLFEELEDMHPIGNSFMVAAPAASDVFLEVFKYVPREDALRVAQQARATCGAADPLAAAEMSGSAPRDNRVFDVALDDCGDRFRTLHDAVSGSNPEEMEDWPLEAVRNTHFVMRDLKRQNRSFMQSHHEWRKASNKPQERAVREHGVLSKALDLAVSSDQLQLANLASIEVLVSRRMLLEDAHRNAGADGVLKLQGSEHIMGYVEGDNGEVVNPAALKFRASKMRSENDARRVAGDGKG